MQVQSPAVWILFAESKGHILNVVTAYPYNRWSGEEAGVNLRLSKSPYLSKDFTAMKWQADQGKIWIYNCDIKLGASILSTT